MINFLQRYKFPLVLILILVTIYLAEKGIRYTDMNDNPVVITLNTYNLPGLAKLATFSVFIVSLLFKSKIRRLQHLALVFISSVTPAILIELIFAAVLCFQGGTTFNTSGSYTKKFFKYDKLLGYTCIPDIKVNSIKKVINGQDTLAVYNVRYTIDSLSRRLTPLTAKSKLDKQYALFFGCSFTFGEGVNDDETYPYYFSKTDSAFIPYNYGLCGYGTQQMLAKLQAGNLRAAISEPNGIAVYLHIPMHINRVIGDMFVHNIWGANMPCYDLEAGELIHKGSFKNGRPFISKLYSFLGKSNALRYFNVNFPVKMNSHHFDVTSRLIEKSYQTYKRQFGNDNFFVVIYHQSDEIKSRLQKKGIKVLDYSDTFDISAKEFQIHPQYEKHPNAHAYQILAEKLLADIRRLSAGQSPEAYEK
ncbi:hypothetical protein QQ020_00955 [Fulvivirgaceae bacterium BMA12]|uniref:Uncharacterized protein n=1 Tax=Agaribacillus aureus TaxID=3051825 RepID=A0ABT8KYU2_9BACT|nr:hypothetical protein [Fulvivirgaceae bacterium BMA12]